MLAIALLYYLNSSSLLLIVRTESGPDLLRSILLKILVLAPHILPYFFVQFAPGTTPVAIEFRVVPKLNYLVIFGISWFVKFNP